MQILLGSDVSIAKVIGGAERVLFEQSTRLQQRGHAVHILTRRFPPHGEALEIIDGVHEWRYPVDETSPLSFLRSARMNGRRLLESIARKQSFDIVNYHQPFTAHAIGGSPAGRAIPAVYTVHSLSFEEFLSRNPVPPQPIKKILYPISAAARRWIEKKALDRSRHIIVLSRFTQEKLEKRHRISPDKISIIPGGVNLERFHPAADKSAIRRRLRLPEDKFILLTVRNLVPRMGLDHFILALKDVVGSMKSVFAVIGGEGPLGPHLKSLARDMGLGGNVHFTGFIPDGDLPDYYRASDLFILPTLELEGFGLVTLEALSSGLPVLGTPVGGTLEILKRLDARYLFDDAGPEAMAARILEIGRLYIAHSDLQRSDSMRCRSFTEENYSWDKNVDLLERIYRRIAAG